MNTKQLEARSLELWANRSDMTCKYIPSHLYVYQMYVVLYYKFTFFSFTAEVEVEVEVEVEERRAIFQR